MLAERGHQVHLAADEPETFGGQQLVERLAAEYPGLTWGWTPSLEDEPWFPTAQKLRLALDYVRFLDPRYDNATKLRLRNIQRAPRVVRWLAAPVGTAYPGRRAVEAGLKWAERVMPVSAAMDRWMADRSPDVVLLASLTYSRSTSIEQLKAARAAGVPVAALRHELGSPVQQGVAAHPTGPGRCLERRAEARGGRDARHRRRAGRGHGRAVLRPVVHAPTGTHESRILSRCRAQPRSSVRVVRLFDHESRPRSGGAGVRETVGRSAARQSGPGASQRGCAGPAAPRAGEGVERHFARRPRQPRCARSQSDR